MMKSYYNPKRKGFCHLAVLFLAFLFAASQELSAQVVIGVVEDAQATQQEQPSLNQEAQNLRTQLESLVDGTPEHTVLEMKALLVESTAHLISRGNEEQVSLDLSHSAILEKFPGYQAQAAQNYQDILEFMNLSK